MNPDNIGLRDIHLPDAISWWPPAPGWWLIFAALVVIGFVLLRRRRRARVRRAAQHALRSIATDFDRHGDGKRVVRDLSALLRRVCLTYHPRRDVARLTGAEWLAVLERTVAERAPGFSTAVATALAEGPYNPHVDVDGKRLIAECTRWVDSLPLVSAA